MPCKIENYDLLALSNTIKNRKNIYSNYLLDSAENIKSAILEVASRFERIHIKTKDKNGNEKETRTYAPIGNSSVFFSKTYSQLGKKSYANNDNGFASDLGNITHDIASKYAEAKHRGVNNKADLIAASLQNNLGLTKAHIESIFKVVDELYAEAVAYQNEINRKTGNNDKFELITEVPIFDAPSDTAGTPDMLFIFSNKQAFLRDFKSFQGKLSSKVIESQAQLQAIKATLNSRLGLEVISANIIGIRVVKQKVNGKVINKIKSFTPTNFKASPGSFKTFAAGLYDLTGDKDMDSWLKDQYALMAHLEDRKKKSKSILEKNKLFNKITKLKESIANFLTYMKIDTLNAYIREEIYPDIEELRLNGETLDPTTRVQKINDLIKELENYKAVMKAFRSLISDKKIDYVAQLQAIEMEANAALDSLELMKVNAYFENNENTYMDPETKEIKADKLGFLNRWMGLASNFTHPVIKIFYRKHTQFQDEANAALALFKQRMVFHKSEVDNTLKSMGKTFRDVFINEKGNLIGEISTEGYDLIKKAKAIKNNEASLAELMKIYNIKPEYQNWYDQAFANEIAKIEAGRPKGIVDSNDLVIFESEKIVAINEFERKFNLNKYASAFSNPSLSGFREFSNEFKNQYRSAEFNVIYNNPALLEFWKFNKEINSKSRTLLGLTTKELPGNFFANVKKEIFEGLKDGGFNAKESFNMWIESMSIQADDRVNYGIANSDDTEIPMMFIGTLDADQKSYDYARSITLFYKMALNYDRAVKLENYAITARSLMTLTSVERKDNSGGVMLDFIKNKLGANKDDIQAWENLLNGLVDRLVYGKKLDDLGTMMVNGKPRSISKIISRITKLTRLSELGLNVKGGVGAGLAARLQMKAFAKKNAQVKEKDINQYLIDFFKDRKTWTAMSEIFNPDIDGVDAALTQRWGLSNILLAPYSVPDKWNIKQLSYAMAKNYGLDSEGNLRRLDKLPEGTVSLFDSMEFREVNGLFTFNIKGMTEEDSLKKLMSFKRAVRKTWNNIAGTMDESDPAGYQNKVLGNLLMTYKTWMPGVLRERFLGPRYDDITDTFSNGRLSVFYKQLLKKPEGKEFMWHLGNISKRVAIGIIDVGTMGALNSVVPGFKKNRVDEKLSQVLYRDYLAKNPDSKISFEEWVEVEKGQMAALVYELRALLLLTIACALMGAGDDDEIYGKNYSYGHKFTYKALKKAQSEVMYFFNPTELFGLSKNGISLLRTASNVWGLLTNSIDTARDMASGSTYKGVVIWDEEEEDTQPFFFYSKKLIPGFNGVARTYEDLTKDDSK